MPNIISVTNEYFYMFWYVDIRYICKSSIGTGGMNFPRFTIILKTPSSRTPPTVSSRSGSVNQLPSTEDGEGFLRNIWSKNLSVVNQFLIISEN